VIASAIRECLQAQVGRLTLLPSAFAG
jgi:hypothetical protein